MDAGWRTIAKTVVATSLVTTTFWFVVAAWYLRQSGEPDSVRAPGGAVASPEPAQPQPSGKAGVPGSGRLTIPVAGIEPGQLADTFTQAREDGARRHDAIDILAPRGTPVTAAAAGRIEKLFLSDDGGKTVYVRSPDGRRIYYYAHLDRYAPRLREGQAVRQGDVLGAVGSTGNANPDAPHLHFAIWRSSPDEDWYEDSEAINPYDLLVPADRQGRTAQSSPTRN
jgi:peptidoglycan LD-endopeptidase LytH